MKTEIPPRIRSAFRRSAGFLVGLSFALLLASLFLTAASSRENGGSLEMWECTRHGAAALVHVLSLALLRFAPARPRLTGAFMIFGAAGMGVFQAGLFHIGFWPQVGLMGSAGLLCLTARSEEGPGMKEGTRVGRGRESGAPRDRRG